MFECCFNQLDCLLRMSKEYILLLKLYYVVLPGDKGIRICMLMQVLFGN